MTATAAIPLPGGFHAAPRLEYRRRISQVFDLFVEGTNLFVVSYQEVAGVRMPGAAMTVSLAIAGR